MNVPEMAAIARLAGRGARRNWKRTTLIVALIAVPVAASQVAAGMVKSSRIEPEEYVAETLGDGDVRVTANYPTPRSVGWVSDQLASLAPGAEMLRFRNAYGTTPALDESLEVTDLDLEAPLAAGMLHLAEGRLPSAPGEVALSDRVATLAGSAVGDGITLTVATAEPDEFSVVGIVRDPIYKGRTIAVVSPAELDRVFAEVENTTDFLASRDVSWIVASDRPDELATELSGRWRTDRASFRPEPAVRPRPEPLASLDRGTYLRLTADQVATLVEFAEAQPSGVDLESIMTDEAWRLIGDSGPEFPSVYAQAEADLGIGASDASALRAPAVLGTVVAALLMAEVALVAGAAYATGIRRRLRELGLLAVNGATRQHLRWVVVGEGLVAGIAGAMIGTALAVTAMRAGRPVMQLFVDRFIVGVPLRPLELLAPALVGVAAAALAAWVPARSAARVAPITALEGRMPLAAPHRWVVPAGVGLAVSGAFLLAVAVTTSGDTGAAQAGFGVVLMIVGFAMLTGPIVAWVGTRADTLPAVTRLVVRDSARQRTRAASAMAATMVVLVAPVAIGASLQTDEAQQLVYGLPEDRRQVLVASDPYSPAEAARPVEPEAVAAVAALLPDATVTDVAVFREPAVLEASDAASPTVAGDRGSDQQAIDESVEARTLTIARDTPQVRAALDLPDPATGTPIVLGVEERPVRVTVGGVTVDAVEVPAHVMRSSFPRLLVDRVTAADLGLGPTHDAALFVNDRSLTDGERAEVDGVDFARPAYGQRFTSDQLQVAAGGATLLVVLLIVALVTALAATESDHDIRSMVAIGAPPRIRRRFLGIQTAYYTLFAAVLAVPLAMLLLNVAIGDTSVNIGPFGAVPSDVVVTPWLTIGIVTVALPVVVGVVTSLVVRAAPTTPPHRAG